MNSPQPTGTVKTYVGGKRSGYGQGYRGNKVIVAGAIERSGKIRLRLVPNTRRHNLESFIESTVDDDAESIYTDELKSYEGIAGPNDQTVEHKSEEWARGNVHTNTVESAWSLLKRSVVGTYHHMSVKHPPRISPRWNGASTGARTPTCSATRCSCSYTATRCPTTSSSKRDDPGERQRENDGLMQRETKRGRFVCHADRAYDAGRY